MGLIGYKLTKRLIVYTLISNLDQNVTIPCRPKEFERLLIVGDKKSGKTQVLLYLKTLIDNTIFFNNKIVSDLKILKSGKQVSDSCTLFRLIMNAKMLLIDDISTFPLLELTEILTQVKTNSLDYEQFYFNGYKIIATISPYYSYYNPSYDFKVNINQEHYTPLIFDL